MTSCFSRSQLFRHAVYARKTSIRLFAKRGLHVSTYQRHYSSAVAKTEMPAMSTVRWVLFVSYAAHRPESYQWLETPKNSGMPFERLHRTSTWHSVDPMQFELRITSYMGAIARHAWSKLSSNRFTACFPVFESGGVGKKLLFPLLVHVHMYHLVSWHGSDPRLQLFAQEHTVIPRTQIHFSEPPVDNEFPSNTSWLDVTQTFDKFVHKHDISRKICWSLTRDSLQISQSSHEVKTWSKHDSGQVLDWPNGRSFEKQIDELCKHPDSSSTIPFASLQQQTFLSVPDWGNE